MKITTVLLLLMTVSAIAQSDDKPNEYTPFNPQAAKNSYGIKAKLLPYTIGNSFGTYSSLGAEIGFLKNQSVTVEGFYNYEQSSNDEVIDRLGNEFDSGNRAHMNETALQLGYRYYYGIQRWRANWRLAFYNGLFFRTEQTKLHFDKNYEDIPYINRTMNVRAFGLLTGMVQRFRNDDHFGIDYNVSLGKSFTKSNTYNIEEGATFSTKNKHDSFYFNLGISINYWF